METSHRIFVGDSRDMSRLGDDEVELIVTSPPYPMIEMWDELFTDLNPDIGAALDSGDGQEAFDLMNAELENVWDEMSRVLVDGGIACINIGDATRKVDDSFRVYPNHARITDYLEGLDFEPLPDILWRKPTNSAAKFMGSGMLPPNAYVTLEHEYLLIFRNGKTNREFASGSDERYKSAYFWEERNEWFSDVWTEIRGTFQPLDNGELRERSAAYPFEIPYRLISMYSVYGDTVLDPFWGTGTTSLSAMVAGRNSVGFELREEFTEVFREKAAQIERLSRETVSRRIERHEAFVEERLEGGGEFKYESDVYGFPVTTKQERTLQLYTVDAIEEAENEHIVTHSPYSKPEPTTDDRS